MWKIIKFSLQPGLELMTTRMIDEVLTNWAKEALLLSYIRNDVYNSREQPDNLFRVAGNS